MKKRLLATLISGVLLSSVYSNLFIPQASAYELTSFSTIRNVEITEEEKNADIINFNEFLRIYYYNYLEKKNEKDKNKLLVNLNSSINTLKYSKKESGQKPPIVLHWTDADNALGVIKTLFKERKGMEEGVIGVDYVVTEPLLHPDYPERPARAYSVKFSKSEVATTWYKVDKKDPRYSEEHKKYKTSINVEIVGWRFFKNEKGKKNDFSKYGKKGIREEFDGDYQKIEDFDKYSTYPTVLNLLNYLSEKHEFSYLIDEYEEEKEVDLNLKEKGILYLDGPLSQYIKGHALIGWEHTLKYGGDYNKVRFDFVPKELLTLYSDLKSFRQFKQEELVVNELEEVINNTPKLTNEENDKLREKIAFIKSTKKKDYLFTALYVNGLKIENTNNFNDARRNIDNLDPKYKNKLVSVLLNKFVSEAESIQDNEYAYIRGIISSLQDSNKRELLYQSLFDRYAYVNKSKKES